MNGKRKKKDLRRIDFDNYIWKCFIEFLEKPENNIMDADGQPIKNNSEFNWKLTRNRNKEQVPDEIWFAVLHNHLRNNYN